MSLRLRNQQHVLNKVFINKQKPTSNKVTYTLVYQNVARDAQEPNPVFPVGANIHYSLIPCSQQLYRMCCE